MEKNYDLLSFFFDGVPNPDALPIMASSGDPAAIRLSPTYTAHSPYLNGKCSECHGRGFSPKVIDVDVCVTCHEGVRDAYRYMHGPVAFGACLMCHVPHESAYKALLKVDSRALCMQCHEVSMLSVDTVAEHGDETARCLSCHVGHGDSQRYLLRDGSRPGSDGTQDGDNSEPGG